MKGVVLGLGGVGWLVVAAGCTFDLPPQMIAPPDVERVWLQLQLSTTNPASGDAAQTLEYAPITPAPMVRVGPLGGALAPVEYENDGTVPVPSALFDAKAPWRFAYQLAGDVPREVQWQPSTDQPAFVVVPRLGRTERPLVPAGSGYSITTSGVATHTSTDVFTTGMWTRSRYTGTRGTTLLHAFPTKAEPFEGMLGAPDPDQADHGVIVDYAVSSMCRVAAGNAVFRVPALAASSPSPVTPVAAYSAALSDVSLQIPLLPAPIYARLGEALGSREGTSIDDLRWTYGYLPSASAFGFVRPGSDQPGEYALPNPHILPFKSCPSSQGSEVLAGPQFADSTELRARFLRAVYIEIVDTRTVGTAKLASGFAGVLTSTSSVFLVDFSVAAPRGLSLRAGGVEVADLSGSADGVAIPAGTEPLELQMTLENNAGVASDAAEVTVHAIAGGSLTPRAVITTTGTSVWIDREYLQRGVDHVLEVRTYRGRPGAQRGDFRVNSLPQYAATVFSRTFRAP